MGRAGRARAAALAAGAVALSRLLGRCAPPAASIAAPAPQQRRRPAVAEDLARATAQAERPDGDVFTTSSVEGWLLPESGGHRGMLVSRPVTWVDIQHDIDRLEDSGLLGRLGMLREVTPVPKQGGEAALRAELASAGARLTEPLAEFGLPGDVLAQLRADAEDIGAAVGRLLLTATELDLKVEVVGENRCSRWHQDKYVARVISTYNSHATQYIGHDDVDLWELNNCGNNDCVVKDKSKVLAAGVGDILFIKGTKFPNGVNGLVHKSPELRFHDDGSVKRRLCLKVDVPSIP